MFWYSVISTVLVLVRATDVFYLNTVSGDALEHSSDSVTASQQDLLKSNQLWSIRDQSICNGELYLTYNKTSNATLLSTHAVQSEKWAVISRFHILVSGTDGNALCLNKNADKMLECDSPDLFTAIVIVNNKPLNAILTMIKKNIQNNTLSFNEANRRLNINIDDAGIDSVFLEYFESSRLPYFINKINHSWDGYVKRSETLNNNYTLQEVQINKHLMAFDKQMSNIENVQVHLNTVKGYEESFSRMKNLVDESFKSAELLLVKNIEKIKKITITCKTPGMTLPKTLYDGCILFLLLLSLVNILMFIWGVIDRRRPPKYNVYSMDEIENYEVATNECEIETNEVATTTTIII